jgi:hypothetical protein
MSNKLLEAAVLKLRSDALASSAKIEALLNDPLNGKAAEQIEKEAIKLAQCEMALSSLRRLSSRPQRSEMPITRNRSRQLSGQEEPISTKAFAIAKTSPAEEKIDDEHEDDDMNSEDVEPALDEPDVQPPSPADDLRQLMSRRGPRSKTPLQPPPKKNKR